MARRRLLHDRHVDTCPDPALRLWEAVRRLASDPYLHHTELVRGYLYDETADTLTELWQARSMTSNPTEVR